MNKVRLETGDGFMLSNISRSLTDILGEDYCRSAAECAVLLNGIRPDKADELISRKVDYFSQNCVQSQNELLHKVGRQVVPPFKNNNSGAPTISYKNAANLNAAPIGAGGMYRIGEDGKLYLISKSEHYHTPLGHHFGGYKLINFARELGIPNATHNNTRGYITRCAEREIIRCINGIAKNDDAKLEKVLQSEEPGVLNRIINLETGSLAVEAGIKMMLARFYKLAKVFDKPKYSGKVPVFFVMADNEGGSSANYHGTTIIAQTLRELWPEFYSACEEKGVYKIVSVQKNEISDFECKIKQYNRGVYKTAGFLHEIIMMNYGGIRLKEEFLQKAYALCVQYDTPTLADEIQSCMWYKGMFLHRLYGLKPDIVILGKGFPGGEYPASKVITTHEMDSLNQFGALVTNGQEELASLAYLITMEFVSENGDDIEKSGRYFEGIFNGLKAKYPQILEKIEGQGHLIGVHFKSLAIAKEFVKRFHDTCIDMSVQTYKEDCPPAGLFKLPLIATNETMDYIGVQIDKTFSDMLK
jgi:acetylornithine/succinyldiaminopimelate/putrescine aminotransferase